MTSPRYVVRAHHGIPVDVSRHGGHVGRKAVLCVTVLDSWYCYSVVWQGRSGATSRGKLNPRNILALATRTAAALEREHDADLAG